MVNCLLNLPRTQSNQYQHNITAVTRIYVLFKPLAHTTVITTLHWF